MVVDKCSDSISFSFLPSTCPATNGLMGGIEGDCQGKDI